MPTRLEGFAWTLGVIVLLAFTAPAAAEGEVARGEVARGEVGRLLAGKCGGCHGEKKASGRLRLDSREAILAGGKHGAAIVVGKSAESLLLARVSPGAEEPMPPEGKGEPLGEAEITLLARWIDGGASAVALEKERVIPDVDLHALPEGFAPVYAVAGDPSRERFAVARGATVTLHELRPPEDGKGAPSIVALGGIDVSEMGFVDSLAFSPDGSLLAIGGFRAVRIVALAPDGEGALVEDSSSAREFQASVDRVLALAFSPDGASLAVGGGLPTETGEVRVFDLTSGETRWRVEPHTDTVLALAWSPDGAIVATAAADRVTYLLDAKDGGVRRRLEGHTSHVLGVAVSPDSKQAATVGADGELRLWNFAEDLVEDRIGKHDAPATWVGYRDEKEVVTISADHRVRVWDARNGNGRSNLGDAQRDLRPGATLHIAALAAKSERLLVAREDGALFVFDLERKRLLAKSE